MASIRKRPKENGGGYQVRYYGPDNRLRSKTFRTRGEAVDFSNKVEADIARDSWVDPALAATPLGEFVEGYLRSSVHWRPSTRLKVEGHARNYIVPSFGDYGLGSIRPADVRDWVVALGEHGLAPGTVRAVYASFSRIMKQALIDGLISKSPCLGIALPKDETQREMHYLEPPQVETLVGELQDRYKALIFTAAYTGLRWGELAALKVKNVDLVKGTIRVTEALAEVNGHLKEGPTKTGATRTVALPTFLRQMLSEHLANYPSKGYMFTSAKGLPLRRNFYRRDYVPAVARAGLPKGLRFHDLRHTCAAILIANGAHPKEIQERLGHSTIRVTFDRYGHLFPSLDERLRDGLEKMYREGKKGDASGS
ncbi:site-specific integrase [soil metagenome]